MLTGADAVLRLLELGPTRLLRIEGEGDTMTLRLLDGEREHHITLTVGENDLPAAPREVRVEVPPPVNLSEEEAREKALPLYLSRMWLVEQLVKHKTADAIAGETGYCPDLLRAYRKAHGIDNPLTEHIRRLWHSGNYPTQTALADALGVSQATVNKAVGNARDSELAARITELLAQGLKPSEIVQQLQAEGERRHRGKLLEMIRLTKTRAHR